jgi:hypothetical protein
MILSSFFPCDLFLSVFFSLRVRLLPIALPPHELGDGRGYPVNPSLTTNRNAV